ncbi:hypothetical protein KL86PLE_100427 [uncultured Pleomorphomonas sp.]|uniref:Uncharacterized protein n=1 Tax=uncultured Pleomorphomonas sp. TaxID=442121 RepID=A0A212L3G3_9HYPH|nr:hypothetical protein KL86PLE_100427 [uncultured Pleomorphomonas sp.]
MTYVTKTAAMSASGRMRGWT